MRIVALSALLLTGCGPTSGKYDPNAGAQFRYLARDVVSSIDPVCPMTTRGDLLDSYDPVLRRFAAVKRKIVATPLAIDLSVVEADDAYLNSVMEAECRETDGPDTERYLANSIRSISKNLSEMEAIIDKSGVA